MSIIRAASRNISIVCRTAGSTRAMLASLSASRARTPAMVMCRAPSSSYFSSSASSLFSSNGTVFTASSSGNSDNEDKDASLNPLVQDLVFNAVYDLLERPAPSSDEDQSNALTLDTHLIQDLKMDVFKMYQIMDKVERDLQPQWTIDIPVEEADKVRTLRDIVQLISSKIQ
ncbi:hypothetical protein EMPS_08678 [Entomortierella parvispora]|uniref:Carrier domain-containing protein n=1 Tax=Entomortierella parvispora TaxID=205924 RepID=A0A9P3HGJ1_9FUNG|nr:hypothetical protein EMPS_08678 [Entomortierella parvispora]